MRAVAQGASPARVGPRAALQVDAAQPRASATQRLALQPAARGRRSMALLRCAQAHGVPDHDAHHHDAHHPGAHQHADPATAASSATPGSPAALRRVATRRQRAVAAPCLEAAPEQQGWGALGSSAAQGAGSMAPVPGLAPAPAPAVPQRRPEPAGAPTGPAHPNVPHAHGRRVGSDGARWVHRSRALAELSVPRRLVPVVLRVRPGVPSTLGRLPAAGEPHAARLPVAARQAPPRVAQ